MHSTTILDSEMTTLLRQYAEEIRVASGFESDDLFAAFSSIPRHEFLGSGPWRLMSDGLDGLVVPKGQISWLYHNSAVELNRAKRLNNGVPGWWANLLEAARVRQGDRILHIGCGTGYYTAIMATLSGPTGSVLALDVDSSNVRHAKQNLRPWRQVSVELRNGLTVESGAFDVVIVSAGINYVPRQWIEIVAAGGRLILPLAARAKPSDKATFGELIAIKRGPNASTAKFIGPVGIYPFIGASSPTLNASLRRALRDRPRGTLSVRTDRHARDERCWYHTRETCLCRR